MLHQQHPAARRRHPPRRLPRRADAPGDRLCGPAGHFEKGKDRAHRRRLSRRADGGPLGEGAGPEILVADQGQARLLRSAAGSGKPRQRRARHLVRGTPGRSEDDRRQGRGSGRGARSRAQGPRVDAAEGRPRHGLPARQARRLPGARPGEIRTVHRRGRFRRRLRQAGPQPREPGRAAAPRQDPERRAGALRQDDLIRPDRHAHHRARHQRRPRRIRHRQAALPQDHPDDRRRRGRRAHSYASR